MKFEGVQLCVCVISFEAKVLSDFKLILFHLLQ